MSAPAIRSTKRSRSDGVGHAEILQDSEILEHWVQSTIVTTDRGAPIEIRRAGQDLRQRPRPRRARPDGRRAARCTASSGPTAPGSPRPSGCCSACCARTPGRCGCFGGDPWRDAAELHRRLAYVPGDVNLWPNLTGGEVDRPARPAARRARREAPGRADRAVRARPDQEGPQLLQGQPAEGRAGRGARRPTSSCWCSTSRPPASTR